MEAVTAERSPFVVSFDLARTGESTFTGPSAPSRRPVVFGGQIMGQMIVAASRYAPGKSVKSLHAIFARAGTVEAPVSLAIDPVQSGRAFASLSLSASQGERELSRGLLLMDAGEPDLIRHQAPAPQVAGPEGFKPLAAEPGVDMRIVDDVDLMTSAVTGPPELFVWVRFPDPPPEPAMHQALLSWYTDPYLIGAAMRPHEGVGFGEAHETISTGVISHTLTFHEPVRADRWHLIANRSLHAGGGRTYGEGDVFTQDGQLIASFCQVNMVRHFRDQGGPRGKAAGAM